MDRATTNHRDDYEYCYNPVWYYVTMGLAAVTVALMMYNYAT